MLGVGGGIDKCDAWWAGKELEKCDGEVLEKQMERCNGGQVLKLFSFKKK